MATEKQMAGLTPWKKGQSGNPGGRPKKRLITDAYLDCLEELIPELERKMMKLPKGARWCHAIARARIRAACMSTVAGTVAAKELADRTEGRSVARIEMIEDRVNEIRVVFETAPATKEPVDWTKVIDSPAIEQQPTQPQAEETANETQAITPCSTVAEPSREPIRKIEPPEQQKQKA